MLELILRRAVEEYLTNVKVMISFGVLFVFLFLFAFFDQFFFSSGTVLLSYNASVLSIFGIIIGIIFLYFFSFFISLTVYSVRRDVQRVSFDVYWNVLMKKASFQIFLFYLVLSLVFYVLFALATLVGLTLIVLFILFIVTLLLMYVPQSIVLDENELKVALKESVLFFMSKPFTSFMIVLIGSLLLFIIVSVEHLLSIFGFPGILVSTILVLVVVVPFVEQMKSYCFILKFDLIKQPEVWQSRVKPKKEIKIDATRLREKSKRGKI